MYHGRATHRHTSLSVIHHRTPDNPPGFVKGNKHYRGSVVIGEQRFLLYEKDEYYERFTKHAGVLLERAIDP